MQDWIGKHGPEFGLGLFLALWTAITLLISYVSGWNALAQRFRSTTEFAGEKWRFQSAQMRGIGGYRNCLTVGANPEGMYLATFFLFRLGHPALFIPWSEVSSIRRRKWLFFNSVELGLGRAEAIPFQITPALADRLRQAAGMSWPLESIG